MLALYFDGKEFSLKDIDPPKPGPGEALVKVLVAGVCRTDIEIGKGYMGFVGVPGHEFVGVVEECGEAGWVGKRVTGEINISCGHCSYCMGGLDRHCPNRTVLGIAGASGALAERLALPAANLHQVPPSVSDEAAVFTEPVAACCEIIAQTDVKGKRAAVLGDGKLGILAVRVLAAEGPEELVLVGKHPEKLALVKKDNIPSSMLVEFLARTADPGKKLDLVVEATGRPEGLQAALSSVRPRGVIVLKTTVAGRVEADLAKAVVDEVTLIGSRCGPFKPALALLESGRVRTDDLVSARYPLSKGVEAMREASRPGALKVLVDTTDV